MKKKHTSGRYGHAILEWRTIEVSLKHAHLVELAHIVGTYRLVQAAHADDGKRMAMQMHGMIGLVGERLIGHDELDHVVHIQLERVETRAVLGEIVRTRLVDVACVADGRPVDLIPVVENGRARHHERHVVDLRRVEWCPIVGERHLKRIQHRVIQHRVCDLVEVPVKIESAHVRRIDGVENGGGGARVDFGTQLIDVRVEGDCIVGDVAIPRVELLLSYDYN